MHCNEKTKQNKKLKSQNMGCAKPFGTTKWQYTAGDQLLLLGCRALSTLTQEPSSAFTPPSD